MRLNVPRHLPPVFTHEGAKAVHIGPEAELRRAVLSCLLWEDQFYESGQSIADRIVDLAGKVPPAKVAELAVEARKVLNLRHIPLLLCSELVRLEPKIAAATIGRVVSRADEMGELLAVYSRKGKTPIDRQLKKGLQIALRKFNEYALAKYDRDGQFNLRTVLRLIHAKPENEEQKALWGRAVRRELATPDTWEVALSSGADKRDTWMRLISQDKLGYLALLRNLRNMESVNVPFEMVNEAIIARKGGAEKVFPFRYVAAARAAPQYVRALDTALCAAIAELPTLPGMTYLLVDVSGSMDTKLSGKSDMIRIDAAAALASIWPGQCRVFTFSNQIVEVPPYRGMAGVDAIMRSQPHGGTYLGQAVHQLNQLHHDRLIVITDEQAADRVPPPYAKRAYMINVASYRNGIGYGPWTHIDGFSEGVIRYIYEVERGE